MRNSGLNNFNSSALKPERYLILKRICNYFRVVLQGDYLRIIRVVGVESCEAPNGRLTLYFDVAFDIINTEAGFCSVSNLPNDHSLNFDRAAS